MLAIVEFNIFCVKGHILAPRGAAISSGVYSNDCGDQIKLAVNFLLLSVNIALPSQNKCSIFGIRSDCQNSDTNTLQSSKWK